MPVVEHASDTRQQLTITYEYAGEGWITAQIEEEPAAISEGRTREEAYRNVLSALHDLTHEPTVTERVAYAIDARVVEPLTHLVRRARRG